MEEVRGREEVKREREGVKRGRKERDMSATRHFTLGSHLEGTL